MLDDGAEARVAAEGAACFAARARPLRWQRCLAHSEHSETGSQKDRIDLPEMLLNSRRLVVGWRSGRTSHWQVHLKKEARDLLGGCTQFQCHILHGQQGQSPSESYQDPHFNSPTAGLLLVT